MLTNKLQIKLEFEYSVCLALVETHSHIAHSSTLTYNRTLDESIGTCTSYVAVSV